MILGSSQLKLFILDISNTVQTQSLNARTMTSMTLNTPSVVYIPALVTLPIVRARHIVFTPWLHPLKAVRLGLRLIAALTTITEVKVQIRALNAIPLTMVLLPLTVAWIVFWSPIFGPGSWTRSFPLLLIFLLLGLPVSVEHDWVDKAELRFNNPRYPLNNIHLWNLDLASWHWWEVLALQPLPLPVRVEMHGRPHLIMRNRIHGRNIRIDDHRILRLRDVSPTGKTSVIASLIGWWWGWLLGELVGLRIIVVGHGRRVVALEVTVHFGNGGHGWVVVHWIHLVVLTVTIIRLPIHTLG